MKNTILTLAFLTAASIKVAGQVRTQTQSMNTPAPIEQQMRLKASYEIEEVRECLKATIATGLISGAFVKLASVDQNNITLYGAGAGFALASILNIVQMTVHLNRSDAYIKASATGIRITF